MAFTPCNMQHVHVVGAEGNGATRNAGDASGHASWHARRVLTALSAFSSFRLELWFVPDRRRMIQIEYPGIICGIAFARHGSRHAWHGPGRVKFQHVQLKLMKTGRKKGMRGLRRVCHALA